MSLLSPIFEKRDLKLSDPKAWSPSLWNLYGRMGHSGVVVTEQSAMAFSAVWSCVKLLSDTIASLPFKLYEKQSDGGKTEVLEKNVLRIFKRPNQEMPGFRLFHTLIGHLVTWGNFYCGVLRDNVNRRTELWPLRPDRITLRRDPETLEVFYEYETDKRRVRLSKDDCWHVPGFGYDGMQGYSVITQAREGIGLGMAAEEYGSRFFGQGASPGLIVQHPGKLGPEAHQSMRESISEAAEGLGTAHKVMLLEEGMVAQSLDMKHDDMQFLQTRKFQVTEICRWFRIPPHLVWDLERGTYSNIEQQEIEFVVHSIRPWCVLIEQEAAHYFLTPAERQRFFFEFKLQGLLRGDTPSRYEAYQKAIFSGWMKPNEARGLENLNPDPELDFFMVPMNYVPVEQFLKEPEPIPPALIPGNDVEPEEEDEEEEKKALVQNMRHLFRPTAVRTAGARHRLATSFQPLFYEAARAVVNKEIKAIGRAVTRYLSERAASDFTDWIDEFYKDMPDYIRLKFYPILQSFAEQIQAQAAREIGAEEGITPALQKFVDEYLDGYSGRHVGSSMLQLKRLIDRTEESELMSETVLGRLDEWGDKRADKIAANETVRGNNAITREVFFLAGVTSLVWVTMGSKPCPYCQELSGRVVGIESAFTSAGSDVQPKGQEPMSMKSDHFHPPLHAGCVCGIVAQ